MKVIGTFNPEELYYRQKAAKQDAQFAAMLEFDGQETGKSLNDKTENKTIVVTFYNLRAVCGRRIG